jgi:lactate permease
VDVFKQVLDPVGGSLGWSALCAVLPLITLFVLLGVVRMKAWIAGLISLAVSIVVAVVAFGMPFGPALLAAGEGAAYGFFPILWIVINAIFVYNLTVESGHFDVLRRSFERVSPDLRIQAIIIAFCFGALLEALAGFGTPVAITVVMLMTLGFRPLKAAALSLIANTAPVAFGALAAPITALATQAHGANPDPRLTFDTIGAMVGRQTPVLAAIVPLILVFVADGRRGLRDTWFPALTAGVTFGVAQFVASNYVSVSLTDIIAALVSAAVLVLLARPRRDRVPAYAMATAMADEDALAAEEWRTAGVTSRVGGGTGVTADEELGDAPGNQGARDRGAPRATGTGVDGGGTGAPRLPDTRAEIVRAYSPYLIIIVLFVIANLDPVKKAFAGEPWTHKFGWPGLTVLSPSGKASTTTQFTLNWLLAAGTLLLIAGILTAVVLRISPARALAVYGRTYAELKWAIITVMAVLGLAYVMNLSGQTASLGAWLAGAGAAFAFISPILGWIGVGVTGSDTSANALFGALQVQTAARAGLDPLLLAAANSSGGVLGKMISPQNLAIAAAAVGMAGREGDIFRKVLGWSIVLLLIMCVLVVLQSTPVLSWMIPGT